MIRATGCDLRTDNQRLFVQEPVWEKVMREGKPGTVGELGAGERCCRAVTKDGADRKGKL